MKINKIICGDCLEVMQGFPDNCIDSIVTDPPYGWSFMGKQWDYDIPAVEVWQEALRVLKPGGHALIACGTRTQHRMAVNIEDAGFEIRELIFWHYGSGFPKSLDVGKAVDKLGSIEGIKIRNEIKELIIKTEKSDRALAALCGVSSALVRFWRLGERNIQKKESEKLKVLLGNKSPEEVERKVVGYQARGDAVNTGFMSGGNNITKGTSKYEGYGTALKPATEIFTLARKPLSEKTIAENVLKWGTGGLNIDGCRIGTDEMTSGGSIPDIRSNNYENSSGKDRLDTPVKMKQGRFPANVILDGSKEVRDCFPETKTGGSPSKNPGKYKKNGMFAQGKSNISNVDFSGDSGSAARFFYTAKASRRERSKANNHPTVKPIKLMKYLVKLITPPKGICLDLYAGSGSTVFACIEEGFNFVAIEIDPEYCKIANQRINNAQLSLF